MTLLPPFQAFLDRALPVIEGDPRLTALLLAGSAVTGGMDRWSDLDTIIVVDDASADALFEEHTSIAGALGTLLLAFRGTHVGEPRLLLCLYDEPPLLHVDVKFLAERDLPTLTTPTEVYWSRGAAPALPTPAPPRAFDVQWCADRVPGWVHYVGVKLGRGEYFEAISSLEFLRGRVLAPLLALEAGLPARGVRRIEETGSPRLPALGRTVAAYEPAAIAAAATAAFELVFSLLDGHPEIVRHTVAEQKTLAFLEEAVRA